MHSPWVGGVLERRLRALLPPLVEFLPAADEGPLATRCGGGAEAALAALAVGDIVRKGMRAPVVRGLDRRRNPRHPGWRLAADLILAHLPVGSGGRRSYVGVAFTRRAEVAK